MRTTTGRMTLFGLLLVLAACVAASSARAEASPRWVTAKVYAARFCSPTPCWSQ